MIRVSRSIFATFALVTFAMVAAPAALAASAVDFVRNAGERTFESLGDGAISDAERQRRFRTILTDTFDLPTIGQFVLGRYWRQSSDAQKSEYLRLFEEFIVQAYSNRFKDLGGKRFAVGVSQPVTADDTLVQSEISESKGPPIRVNWRVRNVPNVPSGYKVVDVQVEGVSMSITQRDEFAAVIRTSGGSVDGLLTALRKKTGMER
jgi:phospholipid transport system substrate-binding protein